MVRTIGSVCSGIEAASVAWKPFGVRFTWFSEIEAFPSSVLSSKFPEVKNVGDMNDIPHMLLTECIETPDMICGGTPCQAFSYAGYQQGLNDDRGNLTLKFVDIINANDKIRKRKKEESTIVFWENVEGVLSDDTNAFGCLVSSLAGLSEVYSPMKWPSSGLIEGPKRNVAWRVLDAKYFGLPQQRRRLYLLAGGKNFHPENYLFEFHSDNKSDIQMNEENATELTRMVNGHLFEVFRSYTDCLYAAYGTKWNGNAAAYNGSLFVVQDNRIRRLSPLECERLMGFPDNYTNIQSASKTNRYKAIGNSWAVPVVKWIGEKVICDKPEKINLARRRRKIESRVTKIQEKSYIYDLNKECFDIALNKSVNGTAKPENCRFISLLDLLSGDAQPDIYISPVGCKGILRRKEERSLTINSRLEEVLTMISSQMPDDEIEKKSRVQKRGKYSSKMC